MLSQIERRILCFGRPSFRLGAMLVAVGGAVAWSPAVRAANVTWIAGTGNWFANASWNTGAPPGVGDAAFISNGGTAQLLGGTATINRVEVARSTGGTGRLEIAGGVLEGGLTIGNLSGSNGEALVTGATSLVNVGNSGVVVGSDGGVGRIDVQNGARMEGNSFRLGLGAGSNGVGFLDGAGTVADFASVQVGASATSTAALTITDGAAVEVDDGVQALRIGAQGTFNFGDGGAPGVVIASGINGVAAGAVVNFDHTSAGYFLTRDGTVTGTAVPIIGSAAVNHVESGTTIFVADNTYTGGTTITAGTLRLASGASLAASGAVTVNGGSLDLNDNDQTVSSLSGTGGTVDLGSGTLTVNQSGDTGFAGVISGTGGLTKSGTGTLTLSGANTYSGGTTVSGGTLQGSTTSLQGNIVNDAAVVFSQTTNGTYAGAISGTGTFTKSGSGTVTLSGAHSYTGATTVSAGTLTVNGSLAAGTTLTIASGATLNGTGTINGNVIVASGATLGGGLTVNGTLTQVPVVTSATTAAGVYGTAMTAYTITASNSPTSYSISAGALPDGVALDGATGVISGTPDEVGIFNVTVGATNAAGTGTQALELTIAAKALTVSGLSASDKAYDGTNVATITGAGTLVGVVGGDTVTLDGTASGTFASAGVGVGKPVTVSGLSLGGADAGNYTLTAPTLAASIVAKALTVSGLGASDKAYDGTNVATITGTGTLVGVVGGDSVTLDGTGSATFADASVGAGKTVTVSGLSLGGGDAGNYTLTVPTLTANITGNVVTVSGVTASDKPYDGNDTASVDVSGAILNGLLAGETVTLNTAGATGTFATSTPGSSIVVTISGLTLGGPDAGNYTLGPVTTTAAITSLDATLSISDLTQVYDGSPKSATVRTDPEVAVINMLYLPEAGTPTRSPTVAGRYRLLVSVDDPVYVGGAIEWFVIQPAIVSAPMSAQVAEGETATFSVVAEGGGDLSYRWSKNGRILPGATAASLTLGSVEPADVGFYTVEVSQAGAAVTRSAELTIAFSGKIAGDGREVGADVRHPNGNVYDQVLMTGPAVSVRADPGQITRVSFVDLSDDIVQVEFSGAGMLTIALADGFSGPSRPRNYVQPGVSYMQGHATLSVSEADATTNVAVFSVGRTTAIDQSLFRDDVNYDGFADLARLTIASVDDSFGGVWTGNASYLDAAGWTGVYAPGVAFDGPVYIGNIRASDTASGVLVIGDGEDVRIAGGDLRQDNGAAVEVNGFAELHFVAGEDSHGNILPAQQNRGRLMRGGVDVTAEIVGK